MSSAARRPQTMPTLHLLVGENAGATFEVTQDVTLLGRHHSCHVVLERKSISRQHARIVREGEDYFLENLSQTGVTKVDNARVVGRVLLRDNSRIKISRLELAFLNPSFRIDDTGAGSERILGVRDISKSGQGLGPIVTAEAKLHCVLEISRCLGDTLHLDSILKKTLEALFEIFPQAERGFVVLKEGGVMDEVPRAFRFRGEPQGDLMLSRTVFNHVTEECQAILSTDLSNDSRFNGSQSVSKSQIRTMMCVPLLGQDRRPGGILQIDTGSDLGRFTQDDLDLLTAVAVLVGVAIDNARLHAAVINQTQIEQETADAREVQEALLPAHQPELPGYEFWDYYEPAHFVGGDYFDYLPIAPVNGQPRRWAIALGDVVGKGMPAALLMARLSAEVRLLVLSGLDPGAVVARLNDNFAQRTIENRFITFLLVLIDGETHELSAVNAGHMGPIIHRASGAIEVFGEDVAARPLSISEGQHYGVASTTLEPGDRVVLYTDGVHEAIDAAGDCFGIARLSQAIADSPGPVAELGEAIIRAVNGHVAGHPQSDDITLLCFGRPDRS